MNGGCGIEGEDDDPVKTKHFNHWVDRVLRHHMAPMKVELQKVHDELTEHIHRDDVTQAKIWGGIKVLTWLVPMLAVIVPAILLFVLYMMQKAGMT